MYPESGHLAERSGYQGTAVHSRELKMDNVNDLLDQVPYRHRSIVQRDVAEVVVGRDERVWLPCMLCLDEAREQNGHRSAMVLCVRGICLPLVHGVQIGVRLFFQHSTVPLLPLFLSKHSAIWLCDQSVLPLDVYIPIDYPEEPPIVRLHCAGTLMDGSYRVIYTSNSRKRLPILWDPSKSTLSSALTDLAQTLTPVSINTLIAQQLHGAVRDNRSDIFVQLLERPSMTEMAAALRQLQEQDRRDEIDFDDADWLQRVQQQALLVDTVEYAKSVLQVAVECGRVELARLLLDCAQTSLHTRSVSISTSVLSAFNLPLWRAHACLIRDLLCAGVPVAEQERRLVDAAVTAAQSGQMYTLSVLIECGTSISTLGTVHPRQYLPLYAAVKAGHAEVVQLLVEQGVDVNQAEYGDCAVHCAVRERQLSLLMLLLHSGADAGAWNRIGYTAIHLAAACSSFDTAALTKLLCTTGLDINLRSQNGCTPLIYAIIERVDAPRIRRLLQIGADVHAKDTSGCTALMYAIRWTLVEQVRVLVHAGASILDTDEEGNNVVLLAARFCNLTSGCAVLQVLLECAEAEEAVRSSNHHGETALHHLCHLSRSWIPIDPALVRRIVRMGAPVQAKDMQGRTALDLALASGQQALADILLHSHHCDVVVGS